LTVEENILAFAAAAAITATLLVQHGFFLRIESPLSWLTPLAGFAYTTLRAITSEDYIGSLMSPVTGPIILGCLWGAAVGEFSGWKLGGRYEDWRWKRRYGGNK